MCAIGRHGDRFEHMVVGCLAFHMNIQQREELADCKHTGFVMVTLNPLTSVYIFM